MTSCQTPDRLVNMKIQQKVIYNIGTQRFACDLQEHLNEGWTIVAGTFSKGIGDYLICVVERRLLELPTDTSPQCEGTAIKPYTRWEGAGIQRDSLSTVNSALSIPRETID